jgi:glycerol-3-phosphate dehydrogenase
MSRYDLFVIGGGINGCGIARDAAGRGLRTGLAEMGDLAQGTSSASTKLIHGGLRYLENYEFRLVREALREREVLLKIAPHLVQPLRFVLPYSSGMRPRWLLRIGLFLYDRLAGGMSLPRSVAVDLTRPPLAGALQPQFSSGFEYSDCRVDDARLVIANARDAANRGADILTRTRVVSARRDGEGWSVALQKGGGQDVTVHARMLVNAAGPWADIAGATLERKQGGSDVAERLLLVQGAHIVVPRIYDHDRAYIFQNPDGRIVFAIPYLDRFTLVGTTDSEFSGDPLDAQITSQEITYLIAAINGYFRRQMSPQDVIWTFAGVRALADAGPGKAQTASRDYRLDLDGGNGLAPLLSVLGGKITSYRTLAEDAIARLADVCPQESRLRTPFWTGMHPLPGGDLPPLDLAAMGQSLLARHLWLQPATLARWLACYGSETSRLCEFVVKSGGPGEHFGADLYEAEVRWLVACEWAQTAEDVLWRRTKLGLYLDAQQATALDGWLAGNKVAG